MSDQEWWSPNGNVPCSQDDTVTSSKLANPEQGASCKPPDLCRVWNRRRGNAIKPGRWDDQPVCQFDPWDPNSPFKEQEEISMILRSNTFPGYTYTGKKLSTYEADFNARVFMRRGESSIPDQFRKRNTDFTAWIEKMIQEKKRTVKASPNIPT